MSGREDWLAAAVLAYEDALTAEYKGYRYGTAKLVALRAAIDEYDRVRTAAQQQHTIRYFGRVFTRGVKNDAS